MTAQQHILIIGAGVCGLAIAHGLQKAKIPYTIFDSEEEATFRPREWTMALHWSIPMLKQLLPDNLAECLETGAVVDPYVDYRQHPNNVIGVYDGVNGELVSELPTGGIRVSRRTLRALCSEQADVKFGHRLESIAHNEESVTAVFSNGKRYIGTLLVGTDGARSLVREHLFPGHAETTPLDLVYTNVSFRYEDAEKALIVRKVTPITTIVVHPESTAFISVQDIKDPKRPETRAFQLVLMWKGTKKGNETSEELRAQIEQRAKLLPEPFRSAYLWIPTDIALRYYDLGYWQPPTQSWPSHHGRVTLAGDSAHSMPPHRGQGLNNAIQDAYNFVAAVKKFPIRNQSQAIQEYGLEVAERGAKEVQLSREIAETIMEYTNFRASALFTRGSRKSG